MDVNERADGVTENESQRDFAGSQDIERWETSRGESQERMSTSELLDRQQGQSSTQTMEGQRPSPEQMDGHYASEQKDASLVPDSGQLNERWTAVQVHFVDEPRDAVREADGLVAEIIQKLTERFAEERDNLEKQWQGGSEVSTEDLRLALRHYRSFFQRLLAA